VDSFNKLIDALVVSFMLIAGIAVLLAIYVFFGLSHWELCSKLSSDTAKVQCMEARYE
jgi:hypothetical protein